MKTTRYTLLAAALLLAASCANDPVEDIINPSAPGTALPGGTFVIDYTAGMEGADTRNDLPANQRIQSLDYLIYQSDSENGTYTLLKKRPISDINETTTWPLTRDNMTWAQREALKDTLSTSHYYKMVFVANADDKIWNKEGTPEENMFHALQNVEEGTSTSSTASTYEEGRLVLPPNGQFEDNNMYYMATLAVDGNDYATDEDKTATLTITLQRMINKVEVKLADDVVTGIRTEGSALGYVKSVLTDYYNTKYIVEDFTDENKGVLDDVVIKYMDDKVDDCTPPSVGIDKEKACKEDFQELLEDIANRRKVVTSISSCGEEYEEGATCCVLHQFIDVTNKEYNLTTLCDWSDVSHITISYAATNYPYALDFNKKTQPEAGATGTKQLIAVLLEKDDTSEADDKVDNRYVFYTFRNNNGETMNNISGLTLNYHTEEKAPFEITYSIKPGDTSTEGNRYYDLICNPISEITANESKFTFNREEYNLHTVIGWNWDSFPYSTLPYAGYYKTNHIKWVNENFSGNSSETEFIPYTLTLEIPKVSTAFSWSTQEHQSINNN